MYIYTLLNLKKVGPSLVYIYISPNVHYFFDIRRFWKPYTIQNWSSLTIRLMFWFKVPLVKEQSTMILIPMSTFNHNWDFLSSIYLDLEDAGYKTSMTTRNLSVNNALCYVRLKLNHKKILFNSYGWRIVKRRWNLFHAIYELFRYNHHRPFALPLFICAIFCHLLL